MNSPKHYYLQREIERIAMRRDKTTALARNAIENEGTPENDTSVGLYDLAIAAENMNIGLLKFSIR